MRTRFPLTANFAISSWWLANAGEDFMVSGFALQRKAFSLPDSFFQISSRAMDTVLLTYALYALVSIAMTIWVAQTLHKNGRIFLVDAFNGNMEMADAVNHLLVVGFYLINLGFILLFLRFGDHPKTIVDGVEYLSSKLGVVLIVLGGMHFFNMFNFNKMRKKGLTKHEAQPPTLPQNKA